MDYNYDFNLSKKKKDIFAIITKKNKETLESQPLRQPMATCK